MVGLVTFRCSCDSDHPKVEFHGHRAEALDHASTYYKMGWCVYLSSVPIQMQAAPGTIGRILIKPRREEGGDREDRWGATQCLRPS